MSEEIIRVRAKAFGQKPNGGFVQIGEEFDVPKSKLSKSWHEVVKDSVKAETITIDVSAPKDPKPETKGQRLAREKAAAEAAANEGKGEDQGGPIDQDA